MPNHFVLAATDKASLDVRNTCFSFVSNIIWLCRNPPKIDMCSSLTFLIGWSFKNSKLKNHLKKIKISCKKTWQVLCWYYWKNTFQMIFIIIDHCVRWGASLEERSVKTLISWTFFGVLDIFHHTMLGLMIFCFKYYSAV